MNRPRLGIILRKPFQSGDEMHRILQYMDHVVVDSGFDGSLDILQPKSLSLFIHFVHRHRTLVNNGMEYGSFFMEVNPLEHGDFENVAKSVTNLLEVRPEVRVGIVSSFLFWESFQEKFTAFMNLGKPGQVFPSPVIGSIMELDELPKNATPFILSLSDRDKLRFPNILSGYLGRFPELIFWSSNSFSGIEIKEERPMENVQAVRKFEALYPSAKREAPSLGAKVKGTLVVGEVYEILEFTSGSMDVEFGRLNDGFWVVLAQDRQIYLEEIIQ